VRDEKKVADPEALEAMLAAAGRHAFQAKLDSWLELGRRHGAPDLSERLLSHIMLQVLDEKWKDHLFELDQLRAGIQYRAWGQKDPLVEYKKEAFEMFVDLEGDIKSTFTERLLKFQVQVSPGQPPVQRPVRQVPLRVEKPEAPAAESDLMVGAGGRSVPQPQAMQATHGDPADSPARPVQRSVPKVGRNDPCPCGSGKKYKKCHGGG
jgi:preprotein translocase subunit SecA